MDPQAVREFAAQHHQAVLATPRRDGSPQLSPVTVGVDPEGRLIVSTRETAVKLRNLRRDHHYTIAIFTNNFFGPWVSARGHAEIVSLPEALPLLVDYYRGVSGEHPDWDDYRRAMVEERRVLLRLNIEDAGPNTSG
ncbi:MAG: PPOX class F420-dependent oxidoreductase [Candidatus Dormibacteria bacterium]